MKIFGKERQSLRIKKVKASRAVFMNDQGTQEIEVTVLTEDGEKLTLQMPPQLAHVLVREVGAAYEAINPPIHQGWGQGAAQWDGMS